jgi:hypothetical protein
MIQVKRFFVALCKAVDMKMDTQDANAELEEHEQLEGQEEKENGGDASAKLPEEAVRDIEKNQPDDRVVLNTELQVVSEEQETKMDEVETLREEEKEVNEGEQNARPNQTNQGNDLERASEEADIEADANAVIDQQSSIQSDTPITAERGSSAKRRRGRPSKKSKDDQATLHQVSTGLFRTPDPSGAGTAASDQALHNKRRQKGTKSRSMDKEYSRRARAVRCLDMEGNSIEIYESGMEVQRQLGVLQNEVSRCCRGLLASAGGLRFEFADKEEGKGVAPGDEADDSDDGEENASDDDDNNSDLDIEDLMYIDTGEGDAITLCISTDDNVAIRNLFLCPICLDVIDKAWVVMACLHRFCSDCIHKSLRTNLGPKSVKECPLCRKTLASRRDCKPDPKFDALIQTFGYHNSRYVRSCSIVNVEGDGASNMSAVAQSSSSMQVAGSASSSSSTLSGPPRGASSTPKGNAPRTNPLVDPFSSTEPLDPADSRVNSKGDEISFDITYYRQLNQARSEEIKAIQKRKRESEEFRRAREATASKKKKNGVLSNGAHVRTLTTPTVNFMLQPTSLFPTTDDTEVVSL